MALTDIGRIAVSSLLERFGDDLVAVVLFGSYARGESTAISDLDLFVVVRDLSDSPVQRRFLVYDSLTPLRRKFKIEISVFEAEAKEIGRTITPLLLNIAHDGIVLYDKEGIVSSFLREVREAAEKAGLVRYKTTDGKYGWKTRRKLEVGEHLIVKLEAESAGSRLGG